MFHYSIQNGIYIWHISPDHAQRIGPNLSVVFDTQSGLLLLHGIPALVSVKYKSLHRAFVDIGSQNDLMIMSGMIPVEKINYCINHSGVCNRVFVDQIVAMKQWTSCYDIN